MQSARVGPSGGGWRSGRGRPQRLPGVVRDHPGEWKKGDLERVFYRYACAILLNFSTSDCVVSVAT